LKPEDAVILLVEDRADDILLIQRAFQRAGVKNPMVVTRNGDEAIEYLSGQGMFRNRAEYPLPWLILLDLKMPRIDGFEVLKWVRSQPELRRIVVVVLTSSEEIPDVNRAYDLGANSFMVKPLDFDNTVHLADLIKRYWLQHCRFAEASRERDKKEPSSGGDNSGAIR
jgi:CheY-like chemotaxis protein